MVEIEYNIQDDNLDDPKRATYLLTIKVVSNNPTYSECIASSHKSVKDHVSQSVVSKNGQTEDSSALIHQSIPGFSAIRMTDEIVTSD